MKWFLLKCTSSCRYEDERVKEVEVYLTNHGRGYFRETKVGIWHVTAINFPQADTEAVHITFPVIWVAIEDL